MTLETEMPPPAARSSGREDNTTTTQIQDYTSTSHNINRAQGLCRGGCGGRGSYQGCDGKIRRFNQIPHTQSIRNSKGELYNFDAVLGTTAEQREAKYQFNEFSKKMKQCLLQ